jgi:hypothetical protein
MIPPLQVRSELRRVIEKAQSSSGHSQVFPKTLPSAVKKYQKLEFLTSLPDKLRSELMYGHHLSQG